MGKEFFVGPMELKAGVTGEELEKFWVEEYLPTVTELPGYHVSLCKGHHGKRPNQYLYLGHFESNERLRELHPSDGESAEWNQWVADNPNQQKLMDFFDDSWMSEFTHYFEI